MGMVKSYLDLRGSKSRNLELDFLRLLYVVKSLRGAGQKAQGYLVVFDKSISKTIESWRSKYLSTSEVQIVPIELSAGELSSLQIEKKKNAMGNRNADESTKPKNDSVAECAEEIGERKLRELILDEEPGVDRVTDEEHFPFKIRWDFYGVQR